MRTISMNSVPFGREECFFRALIIKRRASGTGAANRCAKKPTRAARCAHDARAFARFAEARRAYGAHGPQARRARTLDRVGFVGKARAIRVGNRGTPRGKTRWNRVGFAPDPRGIPARPTPTKRKMASLQWKSGPAQTKQRTGGAFGEDRHARNLHLLRHQNHNQLREERSAPQGALPCFLRRPSRRYTRRKESCLRASFLPARRNSS